MSQEVLIIVVRIVALALVALIVGIIIRLIKQASHRYDDEFSPFSLNGQQREGQESLDNKSQLLNVNFLRKRIPDAKTLEGAPELDFPLFIFPGNGRAFSMYQIDKVMKTFGLCASPFDTFEMVNQDGGVMFSVINYTQEGSFTRAINENIPVKGICLVMQLPNGQEPAVAFDYFYSIVYDIAQTLEGRLYDCHRRPFTAETHQLYRQAVAQFRDSYHEWLLQQQRR